MGVSEKQAQDELREAVPWVTILLRQEHYPEDWWQEICVQIRV